jgi:predicted amidophosphoribosyltransferase
MPMPFHCIECDKPINTIVHGICNNCQTKIDEKMHKFYNEEEE